MNISMTTYWYTIDQNNERFHEMEMIFLFFSGWTWCDHRSRKIWQVHDKYIENKNNSLIDEVSWKSET